MRSVGIIQHERAQAAAVGRASENADGVVGLGRNQRQRCRSRIVVTYDQGVGATVGWKLKHGRPIPLAGENSVGRQAACAGVQSRLIKAIVVGDVERRCIRCSGRGAVRGQQPGIVTRHRDRRIPAGNYQGEQPAGNDSADEVGQPHVRKVASGWQIGGGRG